MRITHFLRSFFVCFLFILLQCQVAYSQICDPTTPTFTVDLSTNPNGSWTSTPPVSRNGNCCGTSSPDQCIQFIITLSPQAVAIDFHIATGAVPPGALFYQINCGPPQALGTVLCLNGPGPYTLTFCKPGNNVNTYEITSIAAPTVSPDDTTGAGCNITMHASGLLVDSTITWNSIFPGALGVYNSYLSCTTGCDSAVVAPQPGSPPYIDYQVCGKPSGGVCVSSNTFCDTIRIYISPPLLAPVVPNPAAYCADTSGITLIATPSGGLPPYTTVWTNNINGTGTVTGAGTNYTATVGGNYSFVVYDKNYPQCPATITNVPVTVSPIPVINAGPDQILCGANAATLNASVSGSTGAIWSGGSGTYSLGNTSPNSIYIPTAAELAIGTVTLTLTSTGNGACVPRSDQVVLNFTPPLLAISSALAVSCNGGANGSTTVTTLGGTPSYSYTWSPTGGNSASASGLSAGSYTCFITDANGCPTNTVITITQPTALTVSVAATTSISCNGVNNGASTIAASGGTPSYSYTWSPAGGNSASATGLSAGSYTCFITDANGCPTNTVVTITQPATALTVSIAATTSISCNGVNNGASTIAASGGTPSYSYTWSPAGGNNPGASGLSAGSYTCFITDANGCPTNTVVTITQPATALTVSVAATTSISCNGGTGDATIAASGGTPSYSYTWSPTGGNSASASGLSAGNYTCFITDANGCPTNTVVTIAQPTVLTGSVASTSSISCNGGNGSTTVTVSGGTPSYSYTWSPAGGNNPDASGLSAGSYTCFITDANGCPTNTVVTIIQPTALTVSVAATASINCNGVNNGASTIAASGGTPSYSFTWSPTGGNSASATGLSASSYTCFITDANGCPTNTVVTITQPATALTVSVAATTSISCNGGTGDAIIAASGGTPSYSYTWSPTGGNNPGASGLSAGSYTCFITDGNGCPTNTVVMIAQPATALTVTVAATTSISCNGGTGDATIAASGGTASYSYTWSPAGGNNPGASGLSAGSYTCFITDANGCPTNTVVIITQPTVLTGSISATINVSCNGGNNGIAATAASGGVGPYTYTWTPTGGNNASASGLSAGSYSCFITDANGCPATNTVVVNITQPLTPLAIISTTTVSGCNGGTAGSANIAVSGGTTPYTITWNTIPAQTGNTATILSMGSYIATVIDDQNCTLTQTVIITDLPPVDTLAIDAILCLQGPSFVLTAPAGGIAPNVIGSPYQWYYSANPISGAVTNVYTTSYQPNANYYSVSWFYHNCRYLTTTILETIYQNITILPQTNIFTPNADKINDDFLPFSLNQADTAITYQEIATLVEEYELLIYDRWGGLLFHTDHVLNTWDGMESNGKQAVAGTYYWIAKYKTKCSATMQNIKGFVQLIR